MIRMTLTSAISISRGLEFGIKIGMRITYVRAVIDCYPRAIFWGALLNLNVKNAKLIAICKLRAR